MSESEEYKGIGPMKDYGEPDPADAEAYKGLGAVKHYEEQPDEGYKGLDPRPADTMNEEPAAERDE